MEIEKESLEESTKGLKEGETGSENEEEQREKNRGRKCREKGQEL